MRQAFIPYRKDEIIALAISMRNRHHGQSIDEVAEQEHIILRRVADPLATKAGFSCILSTEAPKRLQSMAADGGHLFSFGERITVQYPAIIINPECCKHEAEVFWHEFYHLRYSPPRNGVASFFGGYSTFGAADAKEEYRANLFAATVLLAEEHQPKSVEEIIESNDVSRALATLWLLEQHTTTSRRGSV